MKISTITTQNFTLRPYRKGDEQSLVKNANNKKIYDMLLNLPYPYTLKDADEWIEKNIKEAKKEKPVEINFAIDIEGEVGGGIGLRNIKNGQAEVGYWLAEKLWGKGIMTEAVKEIIGFAFETLSLNKLYADVVPVNTASMRVLKKAGFIKKELLKRNAKKEGKWIDHWRFTKDRELQD